MKNGLEKQNYYYRNGIEVKDVIRDVFDFYGGALTSFEAGCVYNVLKYLMRYKFKDNPKQDLEKAIIELEWLKEEISLNEETRKVNNIDNKLKRGRENTNWLVGQIRFKLSTLKNFQHIDEGLKDSALDDLEALNEKFTDVFEHLNYMIKKYGEREW